MGELEQRLKLATEREKEGQSRVRELVELVEELKAKLVQGKRKSDAMKQEMAERERVLKWSVEEKDVEVDRLKAQLKEAFADIKVLVGEIEEKKKQAQANINKLCQIFN